MKIGIGRLDGSLYGEMIVRDFTLSDTKGVFLRSPELRIDWRPVRYLRITSTSGRRRPRRW